MRQSAGGGKSIPIMKPTTSLKPRHVYLMSNGDLRLSANQKCWPEQAKMEAEESTAVFPETFMSA